MQPNTQICNPIPSTHHPQADTCKGLAYLGKFVASKGRWNAVEHAIDAHFQWLACCLKDLVQHVRKAQRVTLYTYRCWMLYMCY